MMEHGVCAGSSLQGFIHTEKIKVLAAQLVNALKNEFALQNIAAAICVVDSEGLVAHYKCVGDASSQWLSAAGYYAARMCKRNVQAYVYAKRVSEVVPTLTHLLSWHDGTVQGAVSICGPSEAQARIAFNKAMHLVSSL